VANTWTLFKDSADAGEAMKAAPMKRSAAERTSAVILDSALLCILLEAGWEAGWIVLVHRTGVRKPRTGGAVDAGWESTNE